MAAAPQAGTRIEGRYRLVSLLGEGTFGGVWRAEDARLGGRPVAVKLLKGEFQSSAVAVARFDAEADALAKVVHPNIVGVIDRGVWEGHRYIVTELVEGDVLSSWIADHRHRGESTDLHVVLSLFDQVCAGLEAAHAVRSPGPIVHRDVKPDNILLRRSGKGELTVKLVDFGIAQLGRRTGTQSGVLMGTPMYMAPEQALGHSAGVAPWTDVFALGVVLVEMLSLDAQPEEQNPWWGVALRRPGELRALLAAQRDDVPDAVWDLAAKCLQTEGRDRYHDAGALRAALQRVFASVMPGATLSLPAWPARDEVDAPPHDTAPDGPVHDDIAHADTVSGDEETDEEVVDEEAPMPWARWVAGTVGVALLLAGVTLVGLIGYDRRQRQRALAATPDAAVTAHDAGHPTPGPPRVQPLATDPALRAFMTRWEAALRAPTASSLAPFYAPAVRWNGGNMNVGAADIATRLDAAHAAGATQRFDWARSEWIPEPVDADGVAPTCAAVPGAVGDVVKVRAWSVEVRPDRSAFIGCPRLEGRYLIRVRRTAEGLRICHETWSIPEGICASCPTAGVCARR